MQEEKEKREREKIKEESKRKEEKWREKRKREEKEKKEENTTLAEWKERTTSLLNAQMHPSSAFTRQFPFSSPETLE